jgi:hypothetical protein
LGGIDVCLPDSGVEAVGARLDARDEGPTLGDADVRDFFTLEGTAEASDLRFLPSPAKDEGVASRATTLTAPEPELELGVAVDIAF